MQIMRCQVEGTIKTKLHAEYVLLESILDMVGHLGIVKDGGETSQARQTDFFERVYNPVNDPEKKSV